MKRPAEERDASTNEVFIRLFTKHKADITHYVMSLVFDRSHVDDIMQDLAVALWRKFDDFDNSRPLVPWACRFAYFEVLKYRQRMAKQAVVGCDQLLENLPDESGERGIEAARQRALDACLDQLPSEDRELLQLRYGSNESIRSLAKRTGISVHKLYHSLRRIRDDLMKAINRALVDDGWEIAV